MAAVGYTSTPRREQIWSRTGDVTVVSSQLRFYNRAGRRRVIQGVWIAAGTPPVGTDIIMDVNKNGTTIFTTQTNRPRVLGGTNGGTVAVPDDGVFEDGDYLTVDIDQVGSVTPGADITVGLVVN
jgi:hypothetical protein